MIHGLVGDSTKIKQLPDPNMCGLKSGRRSEKPLKKEKQEWANEKPKLDNGRRLRWVILSIWPMVMTKIPSETREESWKFLWRRQCCERKEREVKQVHRKWVRRRTNPTRFQSQNIFVLWNVTSPRDNVWKHLYQSITMIIPQGKDTTRWYTLIWCTSSFQCPTR